MDKGCGQAFFQGDGDASAACAHIQDREGREGSGAGYPFHQLFRLGTWDKHVLVYVELHAAKPAFVKDILHRLVLRETEDVLMEDIRLDGAEQDVLIQQTVYFPLARNIFQYKVAYLGSFPFAVEGYQAGEQFPLC